MSHKPGGGLHSRVVKHSSNPKTEPRAHARNPGAVAQYGALIGNHVTTQGGSQTSYRGEPDFTRKGYSPPVGPTNMAAAGPGAGRDVHACGSQGMQGQSAPGNAPAKNTDILRQFGPDYRK